jgi:hypothetical protein
MSAVEMRLSFVRTTEATTATSLFRDDMV